MSKNNLRLTGYRLRLWRQNGLCCIVKVLSKRKTLKKFAFNCLLFCSSQFCSAPSKSLTVCLHIPAHALEECSSKSSSCVGGDTGSQLVILFCCGMRSYGVRMGPGEALQHWPQFSLLSAFVSPLWMWNTQQILQ